MTSVYLCQDIYGFDLQQALARVSGQRRQQALRYRQERDRRLCVAAYRLLQLALQRQYGIGEPPQFTYTSKGKPLLAGHRHIHCSLSHCQSAAAVAVSDHPVGIDIETRDHYSEEVAARVMSGDEMRRILTSTDPAGEFTHLWAATPPACWRRPTTTPSARLMAGIGYSRFAWAGHHMPMALTWFSKSSRSPRAPFLTLAR